MIVPTVTALYRAWEYAVRQLSFQDGAQFLQGPVSGQVRLRRPCFPSHRSAWLETCGALPAAGAGAVHPGIQAEAGEATADTGDFHGDSKRISSHG